MGPRATVLRRLHSATMLPSELLAVLLFACFLWQSGLGQRRPCIPKQDVGALSVACVCNTSYCDDLPTTPTLNTGEAVMFTSSMSGRRMDQSTVKAPSGNDGQAAIELTVNRTAMRQTIFGFGGAFTDTATILLDRNQDLRMPILKSFYDKTGLEWVFGRVPMASTDFSLTIYTYDDVYNDVTLEHFALDEMDLNHKIPAILDAKALVEARGQSLLLFSAAWSAPYWMKTNNHTYGGGSLIEEPVNGADIWQVYANYHARFFEEYYKHNISFWGLTPQNEPGIANDDTFASQTTYYNASQEGRFIWKYLGPTLRNNTVTSKLKMMALDYNRDRLLWFPEGVMSERVETGGTMNDWVDGFAIHWYQDFNYTNYPASMLTDLHNMYPELFILYTEACPGWNWRWVSLGNWTRAEQYSKSLIEELNNWGTGWVDWNLMLNTTGGPSFINFVDAPIIFNDTEFYRQTTFYVLGHFSKWVPPGSRHVPTTYDSASFLQKLDEVVFASSFIDPSGQLVSVIFNHDRSQDYAVNLVDSATGNKLRVNASAGSINTIVWRVDGKTSKNAASPHAVIGLAVLLLTAIMTSIVS